MSRPREATSVARRCVAREVRKDARAEMRCRVGLSRGKEKKRIEVHEPVPVSCYHAAQ